MPSRNWAGASTRRGVDVDSHHRSSHARQPIRGQEGADHDAPTTGWPPTSGRRRVARNDAPPAPTVRHGSARGLRRRTRRPAATRISTNPTRCSTRSTAADCSAAAAQRSRSPSSCARCATPAVPAARRSCSPTARRASPPRSRTGGCSATGRTSCSTACGWPRASSAPTAPTSMCPTPDSAAHSNAALDSAPLDGLESACVTVEPGYVAGEETAAVRAVNGGPAKPTDKPPRPFEQGVGGHPTLVRNVETLANLPFILRHGSDAYRSAGHLGLARHIPGHRHGRGPTTPLCTNCRMAYPSPNCLTCTGFRADDVKGVLMGGYFAGLLNREVLDATLDHETHATPGQRARLRRGRRAHRRLPGRRRGRRDGVLRPRERRPVRVLLQRHRGDVGRDRGAAATGRPRPRTSPASSGGRWCCAAAARARRLDAATNMAASLLRAFPQDVARHLAGECEACRTGRVQRRCGPTKWRRAHERADEDQAGSHPCATVSASAPNTPPEYFSLDDWGYASLIGDGTVAEADRDAVLRALLDCPVHAIIELGGHPPLPEKPHPTTEESPEPHPAHNEAISGFVR